MVPGEHLGGSKAELGVRLALSEMIHDHLADPPLLAAYLLLLLQDKKQLQFMEVCELGSEPIKNAEELFLRLSSKIGQPKVKHEKKKNLYDDGFKKVVNDHFEDEDHRQRASQFFLKQFRTGEFGRCMLDSIEEYEETRDRQQARTEKARGKKKTRKS